MIAQNSESMHRSLAAVTLIPGPFHYAASVSIGSSETCKSSSVQLACRRTMPFPSFLFAHMHPFVLHLFSSKKSPQRSTVALFSQDLLSRTHVAHARIHILYQYRFHSHALVNPHPMSFGACKSQSRTTNSDTQRHAHKETCKSCELTKSTGVHLRRLRCRHRRMCSRTRLELVLLCKIANLIRNLLEDRERETLLVALYC